MPPMGSVEASGEDVEMKEAGTTVLNAGNTAFLNQPVKKVSRNRLYYMMKRLASWSFSFEMRRQETNLT